MGKGCRTVRSIYFFGLICGILLNVAVYKFGILWHHHQFFGVLNNITVTPLSDDSLQTAILPSVSCTGRDVELVICVPVEQNNSAKRDAIRQTWGSYGKYGGRSGVTHPMEDTSFEYMQIKPGEIILVFFTGSAPSNFTNEEQAKFHEEARTYGDIFQDTYIDTYENLTLKSISIMKWVSEECPNTRYVVKADDDVYLNVPLLVNSLWRHAKYVKRRLTQTSNISPNQTFPPPFLAGLKNNGARVIRDKKSKWYTPKEVYKDKIYPSYLSGPAYAMSGSAALSLYQASLRVPLFWMEDIYITGLCAKVAQIPLLPDVRFKFRKTPPPSGCAFRKAISGHGYTITQMKRIYNELNSRLLKCPLPTRKSLLSSRNSTRLRKDGFVLL
ncbi:hexosyltransferase [Elysia marginata]|uniref:Hexosyltransferase n=1 Tax=Elysia marginata TaxID=1093978 RepID=A0AAV4JB14_9GAST|nr:hexosyltransferase [Elysia marginata]